MNWSPVKNYDGYWVSDTGLIKSCRKAGDIFLKIQIDRWGYGKVNLHREGKCKSFKIHRLVAAAFIGPRSKKFHVNHIDGDKLNNCLSNLEYATHSKNMRHSKIIGLVCRGEKCHLSKLKETDIHKIRSLFGKITNKEIAKNYGLHPVTVSEIKSGKSWSWLK